MLLAGAIMIAAAVSSAVPLLPDAAAGWTAQAAAARYDSQTIFQYIDGHGEVYLAYGMTACEARRYSRPAGTGEAVVDAFEMGSPADAYGVFTHSREGKPVDVGQDGSYGFGVLSFWQGRFFVSVSADHEGERTLAEVLALGRAIAETIPEKGERPALVGRLPSAGLERSSVVYLRHPRILEAHLPVGPGNPLAVGPGAPAVTARYRLEGGAADLVLVQHEDAARAESAARAFSVRFLDGGRPARRDDGWCAAAAAGERTRAVVLRAASAETALALLAEATKGERP
jgi:hypothetical protein